MSPPEPPAKQTVDQNPKSILTDRKHLQHHQRYSVEKANDHSNLRVTFANIKNNKQQSNGSSVASDYPATLYNIPGYAPKSAPHETSKGSTSSMKPVSRQNDVAPKAVRSTIEESRGKGETRPIRKSSLEKTLKQNPRSAKAFADWLSSSGSKPMENKRTLGGTNSVTSSSKRSVETIESTGKDSRGSNDATKRTHSTKSRKRIRKLAKASSRSVGGTPRRTKSGKKLKKSKKSSIAEEDDKDIEGFKPAPLDSEYVTELGKITQIIKAVSATDNGQSLLGKLDRESKMQLHAHSMRRPLSGDELKQLLSSITRVVSLHKLEELNANSGLPISTEVHTHESKTNASKEDKDTTASTSGRKGKKKKSRKVKLPSFLAAKSQNPKEAAAKSIRMSRESRRAVRRPSSNSREVVRRSRAKAKINVRQANPKRPYSEGSSASSLLEKDPVQNAAFLRKYYEESTRLANKKSSDDLVVQTEPAEDEDSDKSKKKKGKKKRKKSTGTTASTSKRSIPTASKSSQQSSIQTSSAGSGGKAEVTKLTSKSDPNNKIRPQSTTTASHKLASKLAKKPSVDKGKAKSRASTVAVSDGPRPFPSIRNIGGGENILNASKAELSKNTSDESETLKMIAQSIPDKPVQTPPIQIGPTSGGGTPPKQPEQFKTLEEMINSNKFSTNAARMKSIWEKTPYQPMTHARFRDIVSKYADPEVTIALAKSADSKTPMQASEKIGTVIPASYTSGRAPANLLALPKPWEIKEKLAEEQNQDKTVKELQSAPKYWPESESTSAYNKLNYDYKYNMRKDARHIRKKLREEAIKDRPTTPAQNANQTREKNYGMDSTRSQHEEVVDALKFYKDAMKRNANRMY